MTKGCRFFRFIRFTTRASVVTRARAGKTDAGRATTRNDDDMDGDRALRAFRVVARRASGTWVKGFELICARAGGCVWGKHRGASCLAENDARERARVTCVAMKENLANTPVLLLSEIVDEWFVLNAPR